MFYFGKGEEIFAFLALPISHIFPASSSHAMSANLRQDVEPVQVNGTLSTVCLGSGVSIFSAEKPYAQGQTLVSSFGTCRLAMHFHLGRRLKGQAHFSNSTKYLPSENGPFLLC